MAWAHGDGNGDGTNVRAKAYGLNGPGSNYDTDLGLFYSELVSIYHWCEPGSFLIRM